MRKNVLILNGAGGNGYLLSRFVSMSVLYHAVSASSYPEHSRFLYNDYRSDLPFIDDPDFVDELNGLIEKHNIEFIIPTHDSIALTLMENESLINATIVCSPLETARICRYKTETYSILHDLDCTPIWYKSAAEVKEFPVFLKPDDGQGSKGTVLANNLAELEEAIKFNPNLVICEYLPGEEYTIDCFTDAKGDLLFVNPRLRAQVTIGQSSLSESVADHSPFIEIANKINDRIRFRGYWFIQLRRDSSGQLKLLEICSRFAGGVAHAMALGVNLPLLALTDFSGKSVSIIKNDYDVTVGKCFMAHYDLGLSYDTVYIDYDDTITYDGGNSVNPEVMAYLYQCRNIGRKIILLTHHTATKSNTLEDDMNRLSVPSSLFDLIVDIPETEQKSKYIDVNTNPIFIDNSFLERIGIKKSCNIPVFDVPHVTCLYDNRL